MRLFFYQDQIQSIWYNLNLLCCSDYQRTPSYHIFQDQNSKNTKIIRSSSKIDLQNNSQFASSNKDLSFFFYASWQDSVYLWHKLEDI